MDRLVARIIEILEANVKTARGIKQIYDGDIYMIPFPSMPAIIVSPAQNSIANTSENVSVFDMTQIDIVLVLNAKDYLNASMTENTADKFAQKIVEERDVNMRYLNDTVVGALQQNLDDDNTYVLSIMRTDVRYSQIVARGGGQGEEPYPTIETTVSIVVRTKNYTRKS